MVVKPRNMRWAGHVAHMKDKKGGLGGDTGRKEITWGT